MKFQGIIKIFGGLSMSTVLLLGLNGCSTMEQNSASQPASVAMQPSSSFASSSVCTDNPFLQKYQCSFVRVEQAARSGDPDAQYALGYLYYYGIGTTQDRQTGLIWIRKAASQGQSIAQEALKGLSASSKSATKQSTSTNSTSGSTSSSSPSSNNNKNVSSTQSTAGTTSTKQVAQPDKPLTDYLPNYGEKRIDTTATPPTVNLSTPPATQN